MLCLEKITSFVYRACYIYIYMCLKEQKKKTSQKSVIVEKNLRVKL